MNGETRRTLSLGMPSVFASSPCPQAIIWFEVHTVSWSPFHAASVAWGSIMACDWSGVVYVASTFTGAEAKAPSKSPMAVSGASPLMLSGGTAESLALAKS